MLKSLLIEILEITIITSLVYGLIKLIGSKPYLGFSIIALICFLGIVLSMLLRRGRKHIKRDNELWTY